MRRTELFRNESIAVFDCRCEAGPDDKPYAELHSAFSLSYVRKGSFGYRVLAANDATDALKLATAHCHEIALLIADVVMPQLNGPEVQIQGTSGIGIGLGFSVPLGVGISMLEIIVVLVQAYVFTLLSAVFIGMAIHVHH